MKIVGCISSVIYRNEETGFSIVKVESENGKITTVTGKFPVVGDGETVEIEGEERVHPKYGKQVVASSILVKKPTRIDQIEKYLSSGLISGVGPVTAHNIVSAFKEQTLEIIEKEPIKLAEVRGVSKEKALLIASRYNEIRELQNAVIFLQSFDVSINMAVKIYDKYKEGTESVLNKNPYKLVEDIDGIGFRTADKIAIKMGIDKDSTFRMRAGVVYELEQFAEKTGSTICLSDDLYKEVCMLLNIDEELKRDSYEQVVSNLIIDGFLKEHIEDKTVYLMLSKYFTMEKSIASNLVKLFSCDNNKPIDLTFYLEEYERQANITLHDSQKNAIITAINNGCVVITGGPGTGKTTIIRAINNILKTMGQRTLLVAPTGRASKRLSEATGDEAKTIHRALDINFKGAEYSDAFQTKTDLEVDAVIVDECSMVDTYVMYNLMNAISPGMRLILVGDKDQLPSVGPGNVLGDLIDLKIIPVVMLSQIFRQAGESQIVVNAHKINSGEQLEVSKTGDFFIMNEETPTENLDLILNLVKTRLPNYLKVDSSQIQVLAPMKNGELGVENLNTKLQESINPQSEDKPENCQTGKVMRVGDKVMQTVNDYEKEWLRGAEAGAGVYNGDIGFIEDIVTATGETTVLFEDGRRCRYTALDIDELMLSYAITIHKSQGSEFDAVIIPVVSGNPMMMTRNLLYTAVTRAKKMVVLVGSMKHISAMIRNNFLVERRTLLKELIKSQIDKLNILFK